MDVLEQLDQVGPLLMGVVGNISEEDLDKSTPCSAFKVRDVLEHMVGGAGQFAAAFRQQPPSSSDMNDLLGQFGPALSDLVAAIREPGALDKTIDAPFGAVPGEAFARFVALDGLVHGWDMATATGQSYTPSDELVAEVDAFARQTLDLLRDGTTFGDAVEAPPSATPIERLAAFTGRRV